jgi:phospholipase/carboxylesterase
VARLDTIDIEPTRPHTASVVWLHGLGASGYDFAPIVPMLRLPHVRFVLPHAPERPVTINGGYVMPSWYDIRTLDFLASGREDARQVTASAAAVDALIAAEEARGIPSSRIVLVGFSQGAALALYTGTRHPSPLAGILVLSGYLLEATLAERNPANTNTPLLFLHGRNDDVVPRFAGRQAYEAFAGPDPERDVRWKDYAMGHEVCPEEIGDIARWLHERIG